jgi:hypothetical protein
MTRVSNTNFKLLEAKYFLNLAKENQENYGPFLFNLSACLTAMVSVTYVMNYEFKRKNEGFGTWFKSEIKKLNEAGFDEIRGLRHAIIHRAGSISDNIERDHIAPVSSGGFLREQQNSKWVLQFNGKNEGLFDTCERYIGLLAKMVEYSEDSFKWYEEEMREDYPPEEIEGEMPDEYMPADELTKEEMLENDMLEDGEVTDKDQPDQTK